MFICSEFTILTRNSKKNIFAYIFNAKSKHLFLPVNYFEDFITFYYGCVGRTAVLSSWR